MTSVSGVLSEVETTLRDIWLPTPGEPTKARACTMNLVVVGAPDVVDRYQAVVDEVTSSIPARAILLSLDPEGPEGLTADVSAVCGIGADATCSERIRLRAQGSIANRAASIVDALHVPELPTSVVWLGRVHVGDPIFVGIASDATRVVLDTEYTSLASLLSLARWARGKSRERRDAMARVSLAPLSERMSLTPLPPGTIPDTPYVADLAWTRLAPWQEMIARFFDDPRLSEHAYSIRRIEIKQASETGARLGSELTLLLGWLATRLDWKLAHVGGHLRLARPTGEPVQLVLSAVPRPAAVAPSALAGVAIEAEKDGVVLRATVDRELASGLEAGAPDADVLAWRLSAGGVPSATEQRVRLGANKGARLLERTLHRPAHDIALMESAKFAEDIDEEGLAVT